LYGQAQGIAPTDDVQSFVVALLILKQFQLNREILDSV
jgi:hypothetical protein